MLQRIRILLVIAIGLGLVACGGDSTELPPDSDIWYFVHWAIVGLCCIVSVYCLAIMDTVVSEGGLIFLWVVVVGGVIGSCSYYPGTELYSDIHDARRAVTREANRRESAKARAIADAQRAASPEGKLERISATRARLVSGLTGKVEPLAATHVQEYQALRAQLKQALGRTAFSSHEALLRSTGLENEKLKNLLRQTASRKNTSMWLVHEVDRRKIEVEKLNHQIFKLDTLVKMGTVADPSQMKRIEKLINSAEAMVQLKQAPETLAKVGQFEKELFAELAPK